VTLTPNASGDQNVEIYYTTDGITTPSALNQVGTHYTGPFPVSSSTPTAVNAVAYSSNYTADSPVVSATFTPLSGMILSGKVVSGGTDIAGATVEVYAAGTTGYGSAPTLLTTTPSTVTTGSDGSFILSYGSSCPAAPGDLLYVVARNGNYNSQGANKDVVLMTALGSCNSSSFPGNVTVNEATTIASAYALEAFAQQNSSGGGIAIGAPGTGAKCSDADGWQSTGKETCNYNGLVSAFKAVNNLVNVTGAAQSYIYSMSSCGDIISLTTAGFGCATGAYSDEPGAARSITPGYSNGVIPQFNPQWDYLSWTSTTPYTAQYCNANDSTCPSLAATTPLPLVPYLNASTVPQARINSLANMLASCVEGGATPCGALFSAATPTSGPSSGATPKDTLQAALSIAQNPGSHGVSTSALLALQPATPPYSPALSSAPNDLTLALTFTGGGLGVPYQDANGPVVHYPEISGNNDEQIFNSALAVDAAGHIWVAGYSQHGASPTSNGDLQVLAEFDNLGVGLTAPTLIVDSSYDSIPGGFDPDYIDTGISTTMEVGLAIDQSGMIWTRGAYIVLPVDSTVGTIPSALAAIYPITVSGLSNIKAAQGSSIAVDSSGQAWYQASMAFNSSGETMKGSTYDGVNAGSAVFDSNGNLWGAGQDDYASTNFLTGTFDVFQVNDPKNSSCLTKDRRFRCIFGVDGG
jgi:hypothetical protein